MELKNSTVIFFMDKRNGTLQLWEKTPSLSNIYRDEEIKEFKFQGAAEANALWAGPD